MFSKMHLLETETGRWVFVGKVHAMLADRSFPTEGVARAAARYVELRHGGLPITQTVRRPVREAPPAVRAL